MSPKFKEILLSCMLAGVVAGAALGFGAQAKAGPLDQGPHILIGIGPGIHASPAALAAYEDKTTCLAARDDLHKQYPKNLFGTLACIPGRST